MIVQRKALFSQGRTPMRLPLQITFRAMRRQVEDYERERRQDVKHHEPRPVGWIAELSPVENFGRIETDDGRSLYFHRNSVVAHQGPIG